jgi:hypothetical protein
MPNRKIFHVVPNGEKWDVKIEGQKHPLSSHNKKDEAIQNVVTTAKKYPHSQVKIHRQDGTFQEERTYGDDPHPPDG